MNNLLLSKLKEANFIPFKIENLSMEDLLDENTFDYLLTIDNETKRLDIINKFQHKQFDKKDDGKHYNIGYIAQDMEQIDPNFVIKREKTENLEDRYYINELPIIATLSKAVQELSQQVEKLQDEIKILKEEKFNEINKLDK